MPIKWARAEPRSAQLIGKSVLRLSCASLRGTVRVLLWTILLLSSSHLAVWNERGRSRRSESRETLFVAPDRINDEPPSQDDRSSAYGRLSRYLSSM